ncbi:fibulin-1-like [Physella acuta]|uniref:fibulin-1-like n=1 Tax=Physella acuta TaxID=109671 RepID=UPI0027DC2515|nr:fibulin-1-like [Physella acuta]
MCEDIDECADPSTNTCQQNCVNTAGSYSCSCNAGYIISSTNLDMCDDIDECASPSINTCQQNCVNTAGSYSCSCNAGYIVSSTNANMCEDINECTVGNPCEQICTNTEGSFSCSCYPRFYINSTHPNKCETTCSAYWESSEIYYQASTRKECFESCVSQPLCLSFEYQIGGDCIVYPVAGSAVDTNINVNSIDYIKCSNTSSQCATFGRMEMQSTNYYTVNECFTACVADPFCFLFMLYLSGPCTIFRMADPVSMDVEETSTTFVSCDVL